MERKMTKKTLISDGHRPTSAVHRPLKVQGGHKPPTTSTLPRPPSGGSGVGKPKKG